MSDKIIINIISKTYFIIISFLLFIFISSTSLFILLQNGVHIKELSILNVKIEQLYIKWNEKVDVSLKKVIIDPRKEKKAALLDYKLLSNYIKALQHTTNWFEAITIESIEVADVDISFKYKENSDGFLVAKSPTLLLKSSIAYEQNILKFHIDKFEQKSKNFYVNGDVYVDLNRLKAFLKLKTDINSDAKLTLYAILDTKKLDFSVVSQDHIKDMKHIIRLVSLPEGVKFWAHDAIELDSMQIEKFYGNIDFKNIENAYKNIYVKAKAEKLFYTYNPELNAISTKYTDLEFKDGVLYIYPRHAATYGHKLGKSWLKIDFTLAEELLTLHLLFDSRLDKEMLEVLSAYNIKLPFLQKKGSIETKLKLLVNLRSIDVDAQGSFYTKVANFDYLGLNLDIYDTQISLDNYDVSVKKMKAKYKDIASADVKALYNAKKSEGKIDFSFHKINLKQASLNTKAKRLNATYIIAPKKDSIAFEKSQWRLGEYKLNVDSFALPFNIDNLSLKIPATYIQVQNIASAYIEGNFDLKNTKADLSLDVLNLSYGGFSFTQSNTPLKIKYANDITISSEDTLYFEIAGTEHTLQKPKIVVDKKSITLKNTHLKAGQYITSKVFARYHFENNLTHVSLSNFMIENFKHNKILYKKSKILLSIDQKEDAIYLSSKELEATAKSTPDAWSIHLSSLSQLASNSSFLKKLNLENGEVKIYKNKTDKFAKFSAKLIYPFEILTKNSKPTNSYIIDGVLKNDSLEMQLNKNTKITVADTVNIKAKNVGINLSELIKLADTLPKSEDEKKTNISFEATDSYIYLSETRKIISDFMKMEYKNKTLTAQLRHLKGEASLRFENEKFHLYGKNFNDKFMENIFYLSKFKGGKLDFNMDGSIDKYDGVFYINNSTIVDYKLLNNILAFVNTVPSLVTFSLPGYSSNGLFVKQAYMKFASQNSVFNMSDIYLESKELNILGNGVVDFKNDNLDIILNLKTDLASNMSKIPLVGYIIFDKDSISTTLKLKGKLSDPKVETMIAKEIIVAPLNIIKRTLSLPLDILKGLSDSNRSK